MSKIKINMRAMIFLVATFLMTNIGTYANEIPTPETSDSVAYVWQAISGGGTKASSADYSISATISQSAVGSISGAGYALNAGFWQDVIGAQPCTCTPGDPNNNGIYDLVDIVYLINYVYRGGDGPVPQTICGGDARLDCSINILDITYMISYLYHTGSPPASCGEWTGLCGS